MKCTTRLKWIKCFISAGLYDQKPVGIILLRFYRGLLRMLSVFCSHETMLLRLILWSPGSPSTYQQLWQYENLMRILRPIRIRWIKELFLEKRDINLTTRVDTAFLLISSTFDKKNQKWFLLLMFPRKFKERFQENGKYFQVNLKGFWI